MDVDPAQVGARPTCATTSSGRSARWPSEKRLELRGRARARPAGRDRHRRAAAAADPEEPALERVQVHRAGTVTPARSGAPRRHASRPTRSTQADERDRVLGRRHRHRHRRGQAAADLRGVPAGRRHDQPQVRRHRPGPVDLARDRAPARRRDPVESDAGEGSTFTLYLPQTYAAEPRPAIDASRSTGGDGAPPAPPRRGAGAAGAGGSPSHGGARAAPTPTLRAAPRARRRPRR